MTYFFKTNKTGELLIILKRKNNAHTGHHNKQRRHHHRPTRPHDSSQTLTQTTTQLDWDINTVAQLKLDSIQRQEEATPRHHYPRRSRQVAHLASVVVPVDVPHRPAAAVQNWPPQSAASQMTTTTPPPCRRRLHITQTRSPISQPRPYGSRSQ